MLTPRNQAIVCIETILRESRMGKPARGLGFWMTLALVVGNMIGSGIYLLPATLAPLGMNQLAGWGVTLAGALCLAGAFARLGARMPLAGGPYAYAHAAFGPATGFITAWSYWTMIWPATARSRWPWSAISA
jgi:APA family basic amino acid/polyamine antiporter